MKENIRFKTLLSNFSYTITSNLLQMFVSIITVLILPKVIGVADYGFWQLYLLYVTYVSVIQMGWCDGVYLRYGGRDYYELDRKLLSSQFWYLIVFYLVLSTSILTFLNYFIVDQTKINVLIFAVISGALTTPRGLLYYLLQATSKIKEFARISFIDRIVFIFMLSFFLSMNYHNYEALVLSELIAHFCSLIMAVFVCSDVVFSKLAPVKKALVETYYNITVGFKLMLANFASMLMIGITRLSIENNWGIEIFSKVSLTLSLSNFFLVFIRAVSIILFPILRNTPSDKLKTYYILMRNLLMPPLLFALILYIPMKNLLVQWLPQYDESFRYMALLLPIVIYESKMSMLVNTYLKNLRKEKVILYINVLYMSLSGILTFITIFLLDNLTLSIIAILIILALRSITAEMYVSKLLNMNTKKDNLLEILLTIIFVVFSWFFDSWVSTFVYALFYSLYILLKINDIKLSLSGFKSLRLSNENQKNIS